MSAQRAWDLVRAVLILALAARCCSQSDVRSTSSSDEQLYGREAPPAKFSCETEFCNTRTLKQEIVRFLLETSAPTSLSDHEEGQEAAP